MNTNPITRALLEREERVTCSVDSVGQIVQQAFQLADRAAVRDIETEAIGAGRSPEGLKAWDLRPMLDHTLHPVEFVEMARESVGYAWARGLIRPAVSDPDRGSPMVVVITRQVD